MSKFSHEFVPFDQGASFREYKCDDTTARIDIVSSSCVRVAIYKDRSVMLPTINVNPENAYYENGRDRLCVEGFDLCSVESSVNGNTESISLPCGIRLDVCLDNFIIKCFKDDKLLLSDREPLAYNIASEFGTGSFHYLLRETNEKIYGLGDKGGELDKSGRAFRIETADSMGYDASSTDPLYKHVPFYVCENSVGSYGVFYDTSDTSFVNLGNEINNYYQPYKYFSTEDECLVYYLFFGSKLSIIQQLVRLCGKQAFPPKWSFDYCASTMAYTDAPDSFEQMKGFLDKVKSLGLSCNGFYLSSGYTSIGNQRCVFNWNYDKFPNPKEFVSLFSSNAIEIIPNIKPAFLVSHPMYNELAQKGMLVKNPDGTPFVTQFWDGLGSYLDFTNKEAYDFWSNQVTDKLLNMGITATWNDNNEFDIKDADAVANGFGNGCVKAHRIRPYLTYLMNEASYKAQLAKRPELRPFLSTRSGSIGASRLAQTWSGDNRSEFKDLRYCHYIGLTMSMSGLYFYGHDLGGFSGDMPSPELLLRWLQHGLFEPRFTIHSWNSDGSATMPWSYEEIIPSVKAIFAQRKRLLPYIYNCAYNAVEKQIPMNAPLFLYYDDELAKSSKSSFMLGRDILATCIFDEGEEAVTASLPSGDNWYLDDRLYDGGQCVELNIPAESQMPFFVRAGSVIPTDEAQYGFNTPEKTVFTVYPVKNGSFESDFFTDDGVSFEYKNNNCVKLQFSVECNESDIVVRWKNNGNMSITPEIRLCTADNRKLIVREVSQ